MGELADAVAALDRGELVVIPTDTVYGLAVRPEVPGATEKVFEAKGRPRDLTLPVLVSTVADAKEIARMDDRATALAERFWPGPLTIVVERVGDSTGWDLGEEGATIGVRVPDQPMARSLLGVTGPLAVTSANRSGEPTPPECAGVRDALGRAVSVYVCAGRCDGAPSTVLDLAGGEPRIVREGGLRSSDVLAALRS